MPLLGVGLKLPLQGRVERRLEAPQDGIPREKAAQVALQGAEEVVAVFGVLEGALGAEAAVAGLERYLEWSQERVRPAPLHVRDEHRGFLDQGLQVPRRGDEPQEVDAQRDLVALHRGVGDRELDRAGAADAAAELA